MRYLFAVLLSFSFLIGFAQKEIRGSIIDENTNEPLVGASVSYNKKLITTNNKGEFIIACINETKLVISHIGYETRQQTISDCTGDLVIHLSPIARSLNEVEVTATSNPNRKLLYQPVSITKLTNTELKRGPGLYLDDAINSNVPGVTMSRRSTAGGQQINIRGYGNGTRGTQGVSSNFDMQGTKVYLNGIPVTDAEGITVLDDIDFNSIGSVEVVKGPTGSLYGLAIAGVVNLKTMNPAAGETLVGQDILFGDYGTKRYTTHFQTGGENASILLNYGYQHSDGFVVHTASTKKFLNAAGAFKVNKKQTVNGYFGYGNSYDQRQGELTLGQYDTLNWSGNPDYIKRNAHSNVISLRGGLTHTYSFSENVSNLTTVFGSGVSNNGSSAGGWTDKNPINFGLRSIVNTRFNISNSKTISGITGIETQHQYAQTMGYNMAPNPIAPTGYWIVDTMRSNQFTYTANTSLFTEWTLSLKNDVSFTAGLGYNNMHIEMEDRYRPRNSTKPNAFYSINYNNMLSPRLSVNKVFNKVISLYASYSRGYKAPVSSYFFIPATGQLNTGLKPEQGDQLELGSKGSLFANKLAYQLALYDATFSNKMTTIAVPLNPPSVGTAYSYVANGGEQTHRGIEGVLKYMAFESAKDWFSSINPFVNFSYAHFRYNDYGFQRLKPGSGNTKVDTIDYSGNEVAGVPKWMLNAGIDFVTKPGIYANVVYSYKDRLPITSDNLYYAPSYSLLNAKAGFRKSISHFNLDLFFGANNMTGSKYYFMVFVNQLPDAYIPAPRELNYYGGVNLKYTL
jgi:iron complex outermembrane receptor protein